MQHYQAKKASGKKIVLTDAFDLIDGRIQHLNKYIYSLFMKYHYNVY